MEINRRSLLKTALLAPLAVLSGLSFATGKPAFVTTGRATDRSFNAYILDETGNILASHPLEGRSHGIAVHPVRKQIVIFARRPDNFALALSPAGSQQPRAFSSPENRHFYGHGVFSNDGNLLFAAENDFDNERGLLGVYDTQNGFLRVGEIESGGIGPHEVALSGDGKTLIVANGGIATHPDYPRQKLNLPDMKPNITLIDINSRGIQQTITLSSELHQVSLRHLAADKTGNIWVGGQYQGPKSDDVPLLFKLKNNETQLKILNDPKDSGLRFKHYIGSVALNADASKVAFSAPRGNTVSVWDCRSDKKILSINQKDACGLAQNGREFMISAGDGTLHSRGNRLSAQEVRWDNHMMAL